VFQRLRGISWYLIHIVKNHVKGKSKGNFSPLSWPLTLDVYQSALQRGGAAGRYGAHRDPSEGPPELDRYQGTGRAAEPLRAAFVLKT